MPIDTQTHQYDSGDPQTAITKAPQSYLKSMKCSKSSPHLWSEGKEKQPSGLLEDKQPIDL